MKTQTLKLRSKVSLVLAYFFTLIIVQAQNQPTFFTSGNDPKPAGKMWVPVNELSDEFNTFDNRDPAGLGLNPDKWARSVWNYDVPVQMVTQNSGVANGSLWIKATLDPGAVRWFQSSRVQSKAEIGYPMYTESRIRTAHISAYNTFWLNNGDINNRNEIDIIENNSKPSCGCQPDFPWRMNSQYFEADETKIPPTIRNPNYFDVRNLSPNNPLRGVTWEKAFHVFGAYWKDNENVDFFLDGEYAGSIRVGNHWDGLYYSGREFTRDLIILFDLWTADAPWIGGLALQNDLTNDAINTMRVDWVRTWVLNDDPTSVSSTFYIENRQTGKRIRPLNDNEAAPIVQAPASWGGGYTQWQEVPTSDGYFHLRNVATGMYFRPADGTDGIVLEQRPTGFNGSLTQWRKVTTNNGYFYLQNRGTGQYFRPATTDDAATGGDFNIIQRPTSYSGSWTQWRFTNTAGARVTDEGSNSGELSNNFNLTSETGQPAGLTESLTIYPNPSSNGLVNVSLPGIDTNTVLSIYDLGGRLVYTQKAQEENVSFQVDNLQGLYLLNIEGTDFSYSDKIFFR
ncbi:MAG: RICIN domain-containing protein [Bacteroidota bacterium]